MSNADLNPPVATLLPPADLNRPADWAEPGMGTQLQHQFFYWLMRLGGMARGYHMASIVSAWYVLFSPAIRKRCSYYLQRRFPDRTARLQRFIDTFHLVRAYATTLVDIKVMALFGPDRLCVTCPDHDRLMQLASRPGGFILIHAHVGCWQVGMTTLKQFSKQVAVVMIPDRHTLAMLNDSMQIIDPRTGLESSLKMTETLLAGHILAMMGDRTIGGDNSVATVRFLGDAARFPITPYRIASATGAPILVMTAPRTNARSYELRLAKVIEVPPGLGRSANSYAPYAQQFADCIEQFVAEYPWQFNNFFDLWNDKAGEEKILATSPTRQNPPPLNTEPDKRRQTRKAQP